MGVHDGPEYAAASSNTGKYLTHLFFRQEKLPDAIRKSYKIAIEVIKPESQLVKARNEKFVTQEMERYKPLFEKLEKYPLSEEQMRAAIIDEDRNLLIAAAGSGKSSTIVAKVVYLLAKGLARPEEILVLTYSSKSKEDIDGRLASKVGIVAEYTAPVKSNTFHAYGLSVIKQAYRDVPSITDLATGSKEQQSFKYYRIIKRLCDKNQDFRVNWYMFVLIAKLPLIDLEIRDKDSYEFLRELDRSSADSDGFRGMNTSYFALDGNEFKSDQEVRIANWLVINGIEYEYEKVYRFQNPDADVGMVSPDFYYPQIATYHEHFAIDKNGRSPFDGYVDKMNSKLVAYELDEVDLIQTLSAQFDDGTIFDRLERELSKRGMSFNLLSDGELDSLVREAFDPKYDMDLFITFLSHFKANRLTIEEVKGRADDAFDRYRLDLFLKIFVEFYNEYQVELERTKKIDFSDQINIAVDFLDVRKVVHKFRYILVDEFQDISQDRKRILLSMLNQNEATKLFCVGDDWQSIYQFSGSDIDIMMRFSDHFGITSENYLTKTYRSYQGLVDVASQFVQKNPKQLKKEVKALEPPPQDQVIIWGYQGKSDLEDQLSSILERIEARCKQQGENVDVFVLSRYKRSTKYLGALSKQYSNIMLKAMTVHGSKGLEADYAVVIDVTSGGHYTFPNQMTDDPIIELVLPNPDAFDYAEERRLMYVALTRAKRAVFLLADKADRSEFAEELSKYSGVSCQNGYLRKQPCPKCNGGEQVVRVRADGSKFVGCNTFPKCRYTRTFYGSVFDKEDFENWMRETKGAFTDPSYGRRQSAPKRTTKKTDVSRVPAGYKRGKRKSLTGRAELNADQSDVSKEANDRLYQCIECNRKFYSVERYCNRCRRADSVFTVNT